MGNTARGDKLHARRWFAQKQHGDEGAVIAITCGALALADALKTSQLVSLSLFSCSLKERGVKALVDAVPLAPRLSRLNVQFNAIRGEYKQALERANALREVPLSLAL